MPLIEGVPRVEIIKGPPTAGDSEEVAEDVEEEGDDEATHDFEGFEGFSPADLSNGTLYCTDMTLYAAVSRPCILEGVLQSVHVMLEVHTLGTPPRYPFHLCVVLDRSGSMAGTRMNAAKAAVLATIDALQEGDTLHLVAYDTNAEVVFRGGDLTNKAELHERVEAIECKGGLTNIGAGLELGRDLLTGAQSPAAVRRMFLYSDGCANQVPFVRGPPLVGFPIFEGGGVNRAMQNWGGGAQLTERLIS